MIENIRRDYEEGSRNVCNGSNKAPAPTIELAKKQIFLQFNQKLKVDWNF